MKAFQQSHTIERAVVSPLPILRETNGGGQKESADNYQRVVAPLNARWRVIECRDGLQWILQRIDGERHGRTRWTGRSYCRTRDGLKRACRDHAGEIDANAMAALERLPDWIGGRP